MNRGGPNEYRLTRATKGVACSPPRRGRLQSQDSGCALSFRNQASMKQDLNIDEFGDMGSDEDDFLDLSSNYVPPKPPSQPQYNLVPYGFLRDDDELVEEDYDGVPIDDTVLQDSPKKHSWLGSPLKPLSEEIRGDPITVLGSDNNRQSNVWNQDRSSRSRSPVTSYMTKFSDRNQPRETGRRDKQPASIINSGDRKSLPSLMGKHFAKAQDEANPFIKSGNKLSPPLSFTSGIGTSFITTSSPSSGSSRSFACAADDSNPFIKTANKQVIPCKATSFVPAKDNSNPFVRSTDSIPCWDAKPSTAQSKSSVWAEQGRYSSSNLKVQVLQSENQIFTPSNIANSAPQIGLLQAAALQRALTELSQLGSQSKLNLLGAQNLLMQASQNPTLAAALGNSGLDSIQPSTSSNGTFDALLKSAGTTAASETQSNLCVQGIQLQLSNVGNLCSTSHKMPIPDGSGATRYHAPDVTSLVFDPSTGYRFDASTGLHYDANSGYFFNSELKIYLRWDKFTQTYLRVDNPPGVSRFNYATERMSLTSQNAVKHSTSFSNTLISNENLRSSENDFSAAVPEKEIYPGISQLKTFPTSSFKKESSTVHSAMSSIPADFSKPPPSLPHDPFPQSRFQQTRSNPPGASEQKSALLPNYAETSLFNKLRKAKLAQTAQAKGDQKRWGSPDPLLEAQKHAAVMNKSDDGLLNLNEILQRSRQFMKQKTGNLLSADKAADRLTRKDRGRSGSRERRKVRSHSRSTGRSLRRSKSPERRRSPDRVRKRPHSKVTSPNSRGPSRKSLSPAGKKKVTSKSKSPVTRARGRGSPSPEARRRKAASKGRSPMKRSGKLRKSPPNSRHKRSRGRSPEQSHHSSPELSKSTHHSRTPNHSQSPKEKRDQSPGGSKFHVPKQDKWSADQGPSAERRVGRRVMSPSNLKRLAATHEKERENIEKDKTTDLKPVPYECPQGSSRKVSGLHKNKHVSDYKSLSNLRNQGKDKMVEKINAQEQESSWQPKDKTPAVAVTTKIDLTNESDNEKESRTNHRLVSERMFLKGWEVKKQDSVALVISTQQTDPKTEMSPSSSKEVKDCVDEDGKHELINENDEVTLGKQGEEPDEYDFLNDTLDDDKESTVIDEYEEILDFQDLEGTSETLEKESSPTETALSDKNELRKPPSKESIGSLSIDLSLDPNEPAIEASSSAETNLEIMPSSRVENSESDEKFDSSSKEVAASQTEKECEVMKSKEVTSKKQDDAELHDSDGLEVGKEYEALKVCTNENADSSKSDVATHSANFEVEVICGREVSESISEKFPHEGPEIVENEEWNVDDSVDNQEAVNTQTDIAKQPNSAQANTFSNQIKPDESKKIREFDGSSAKVGPSVDSLKLLCTDGDVDCNVAATKIQNDEGKNELDSQVEKDHAENNGQEALANRGGDKPDPDPRVKEDDSAKEPQVRSTQEDGNSEGIISGSIEEETSLQVRSVSDIEKFLLLSSQEVEAKREQVNNPTTCKLEKKSGIFSRLGEKLLTSGSEPTVVNEETSVSHPGSSAEATRPAEGKLSTAKSAAKVVPASPPKKSKKVDLGDPMGSLFSDDKPTSTIMIGPMNFIEPEKNFQQFTQKYIQLQLQHEKVKVRKVYVCHEDVTGAPYHYVLVMFFSVQSATDWFKKHKGRFKLDEKIFKRVVGNTKHRCIPGAETFLHYTETNWMCKLCKKRNFPPRSLCFGCFQHKDPDGFSPVTILDKGQPPWKPSVWVGTPRLKFFVTKEKVLASAPPLDGFDIKKIEMIMDEKMNFPAGICVFELPSYIDAGKLKKYLNNRDVEAVFVELHTNPNPGVANTVASKKIPLKESVDERLPTSLDDDISVSRTLINPSDEREGRERSHEERGKRERSPRVPSWEVTVPRVRSSSREMRVNRGRSPSLSQDVRFPRDRSPSRPQDVWVSRVRSPSPSREVWVLRGRSRTPLRSRLSRDRFRSRSPGYRPSSRSPISVSRGSVRTRHSSTEGRSVREIASSGRTVREVSPRYDTKDAPRRYRSRERLPGYCSPGYLSPHRHRSPDFDSPRYLSPLPRYRSPSPVRPTKPDGRSDWRYPPPDPKNFRFEPRSGLDYDPTTTLYYEPKSCCFYNDDTNEWLEYDPRTGRYLLVR